MLKNNYNITKEEIESIKAYINKDYKSINSMLETGLDNETRIENNEEYIFLTEKSIKEYIEKIKKIYSAILKYSNQSKNQMPPLYRAITIEELNKIKSTKKSNRICSALPCIEAVKEKYASKWNQKIILKIDIAPDVPYIKVDEVLESKKTEDLVIISPFTQINKLEHSSESKEVYNVIVSKCNIEKEPAREEKVIRETVEANEYLKELFLEKKEIEELYEEKDNLLNTILKEETAKDSEAKKSILEKVKVLEKSIEEKTNKANMLEIKYSSWKRELGFLIKSNLKEIELKLEKEFKETAKITKKEIVKKVQIEEKPKAVEAEDSKSIKLKEQIISENTKITSKINKMKMDLNSLEKNQKKYEDFSKKLLVKYEKQTNIIETKENLYDMENHINNYNKKIEKIVASKENEETLKQELEVSKFCTKKIDKLQKDHEIADLNKEELIEFRTVIYDKVICLKGKLDLKDLSIQKSKIENKMGLIKIIDKIIGKERKNKIKLETIDMKIAAINSSLKSLKNKDKRSVSAHKMIVEIDESIIKNAKNNALKKEVSDLEKLRVALTNIFNIDEEKIQKEIQKKEISNLPTTKNGIKISYEELENWKANEWIKKNKYFYFENKNNISGKSSFSEDVKLVKKEINAKIKGK